MGFVRASFALLFVCLAGVWATGLELPADMKQEAYCVACETMAEQVFRRLSDPDLQDRKDRIDDILRNLCTSGYFHNVVDHPPKTMVRACKHMFKGHKKQMAASIEGVLSNTGTLAEMRTAMCQSAAPACINIRKPVYSSEKKVNTMTDENTLDAIEAYIAAHDGEMKIPRPTRKDEL